MRGNSEVAFDKASVNFVFDVKIVRENIEANGYRSFDRLDYKLLQSSFHGGNGFSSRSLVDDQLANHGIVIC